MAGGGGGGGGGVSRRGDSSDKLYQMTGLCLLLNDKLLNIMELYHFPFSPCQLCLQTNTTICCTLARRCHSHLLPLLAPNTCYAILLPACCAMTRENISIKPLRCGSGRGEPSTVALTWDSTRRRVPASTTAITRRPRLYRSADCKTCERAQRIHRTVGTRQTHAGRVANL